MPVDGFTLTGGTLADIADALKARGAAPGGRLRDPCGPGRKRPVKARGEDGQIVHVFADNLASDLLLPQEVLNGQRFTMTQKVPMPAE